MAFDDQTLHEGNMPVSGGKIKWVPPGQMDRQCWEYRFRGYVCLFDETAVTREGIGHAAGHAAPELRNLAIDVHGQRRARTSMARMAETVTC